MKKKWGFVIVVIIILLISLGVFFYRQIITGKQILGPSGLPGISFIDPTATPVPVTIITDDSFKINLSITDSDLGSAAFSWDNINYSFYDPSLVLMMSLDNRSELGENSTYAVDVSRYGNNGTVIGGGTWNSNGIYGGAYSFDGVDDHIRVSSSNLNILGNLTIAFWVKRASNGTAIGGAEGLVTRYFISTPLFSQYYVRLSTYDSSASVDFTISNNTDFSTASGGNTYLISDTNWHYIVATFDNASRTMRLYQDGMNIATTISNFSSIVSRPSALLGIGAEAQFPRYPFNGTIDEVRIWNRSFSDADVREQYSANFYKYNSGQWYLSINQSNLIEKSYTYQGFASNSIGQNATEVRTLIRNSAPLISFVPPTLDSGTSTTNNYIDINVSIADPDIRRILFNWNNTNYTLYDDSLVLMMSLDNRSELGENSTYAVDVSRYGNNGTVIGGGTWNSNGIYGGAYSFDGIDDYIDLGNSNSMDLSKEFTLSAWIYRKVDSGLFERFITKSDSNGAGNIDWSYFFQINLQDKLNVGCGKSSLESISITGSTNISLNSWHYVVGVKNATDFIVYLDGSVDGYGVNGVMGDCQDNDWSTFIGRLGFATSFSYNFNGTIDEVSIWNRSLSANDIKLLYSSSLTKFSNNQWGFEIHQSNLAASTYSYFACAKDVFIENCTERRNIIITSTPSGETSGPTSSGGGGPPGAAVIYFFNEAQIFQGVYANISRTDKVNISVFGSTHVIKFDSFTKNIYTIAFDSNKFVMGIGNVSNFDLNGDGKDDFSLQLISFSPVKVLLYLKGVAPEILTPVEPVEENKTENIPAPAAEAEKEKPTSWLFIVKNNLFFSIVFGVIFVGLMIVIISIYLHLHQAAADRKPKEKKHIHIPQDIPREKPKQLKVVQEVKPKTISAVKQTAATSQVNIEFTLNQKIKSLKIRIIVSLLLAVVGLILVGLVVSLGLRGIISNIIFYSAGSIILLLEVIFVIIFFSAITKKRKLARYLNEWQLKKLTMQREFLQEKGISPDNAS